MKFNRHKIDEIHIKDLIKEVIISQSTLRGVVESNHFSSGDRHKQISEKIEENTILLESVLEELKDLKIQLENLSKPWYKRMFCI